MRGVAVPPVPGWGRGCPRHEIRNQGEVQQFQAFWAFSCAVRMAHRLHVPVLVDIGDMPERMGE